MGAFRREYQAAARAGKAPDIKQGLGRGGFVWRTFITSGKAIIINAASVGAGFAVLIFSQFNIMRDLGLLITLTMFTSAIASLTVIPVLLILLRPKFLLQGTAADSKK
jgi:predicted RND superfamily exporter protein